MTDPVSPITPPPPVYAVWITGQGWLRAQDTAGRVFADLDPRLAETAARMLAPRRARVERFDESMLDLEPVFLACEADRRLSRRLLLVIQRIQLWLISIR